MEIASYRALSDPCVQFSLPTTLSCCGGGPAFQCVASEVGDEHLGRVTLRTPRKAAQLYLNPAQHSVSLGRCFRGRRCGSCRTTVPHGCCTDPHFVSTLSGGQESPRVRFWLLPINTNFWSLTRVQRELSQGNILPFPACWRLCKQSTVLSSRTAAAPHTQPLPQPPGKAVRCTTASSRSLLGSGVGCSRPSIPSEHLPRGRTGALDWTGGRVLVTCRNPSLSVCIFWWACKSSCFQTGRHASQLCSSPCFPLHLGCTYKVGLATIYLTETESALAKLKSEEA